MSREPSRRVLLGIGIPLAAALFIALMLWAMSRILLAVDPEIAPWVALGFAANILVASALAALLRSRRSFVLVVLVMVGVILVGGIAGAVADQAPVHSLVAEEHTPGAAPPTPPPTGKPTGEPTGSPTGKPTEAPPPGPTVVAENISFSTSEITLPAGKPATIAFDNRDAGTPHNLSIYTEAGGEPLFQGEIVTGPATAEFEVPPLDPGTDYFQCDVHPQMNGTVTVE